MADDDEEPTLFGPDGTIHAHARATDPRTSHEAAASITSDKIRASQDAVLRVLRRTGPICDAELVRVYQQRAADWQLPSQSESGLRTRRKELSSKGLVEDSGEKVRLASGRQAIVWRLA